MTLLERVEDTLKSFRPKTHRQFVVFNVASRFDDLPHLARYLNLCHHPVAALLDAARRAEGHALAHGTNPVITFFTLLVDQDRKEAA
jgi:hypothetical protein